MNSLFAENGDTNVTCTTTRVQEARLVYLRLERDKDKRGCYIYGGVLSGQEQLSYHSYMGVGTGYRSLWHPLK